MACDAADETGVVLPPPSVETVDALRDVIPGFGSIGNPADLAGGPGGAQRFAGALRAFAADPEFGTVVVPLGPSMDGVRERVLDAAVVAETSPANVCVYWVNPWDSGPAMDAILADERLSVFRSLRRMFTAVRAWDRWSRLRVDPPSTGTTYRPDVTAAVDEAVRGSDGARATLSEHASRAICAVAGIPLVRAELVTDRHSAARAAQRLGARTVVKVVSADLPHKSEAGGVLVGLDTPERTAQAFDDVVRSARTHRSDARIEGVLVSEMLTGIAELLIGARRDPVFGPAVVVNWGGTDVELLGAPAVRLAPVGTSEAHAMLAELPGFRRLTGYRGAPNADRDALAAAIVALSELIAADDRIAEVELNPVLARKDGAAALDALIVLEPNVREEPSDG
jgi:acyl-CoA synthetase (NDP forming)